MRLRPLVNAFAVVSGTASLAGAALHDRYPDAENASIILVADCPRELAPGKIAVSTEVAQPAEDPSFGQPGDLMRLVLTQADNIRARQEDIVPY